MSIKKKILKTKWTNWLVIQWKQWLIERLANVGKPLPKVTWWRESRLLDSKSENIVHGRVRNTLRITNLNRSDIGMTLTCQASNNNVSVPASTATLVDMKRKSIHQIDQLLANYINNNQFLLGFITNLFIRSINTSIDQINQL